MLWTHPRGSLHYDVMVTLILLFIFLSPLWINFGDKPAERVPHQTGVIVLPDGHNGFIYEIDAAAVRGQDDAAVQEDLLRVIEPIAGEVTILGFEPLFDDRGRVNAYKVRVQR